MLSRYKQQFLFCFSKLLVHLELQFYEAKTDLIFVSGFDEVEIENMFYMDFYFEEIIK